jgi:hypothetical protein
MIRNHYKIQVNDIKEIFSFLYQCFRKNKCSVIRIETQEKFSSEELIYINLLLVVCANFEMFWAYYYYYF